MKLFDKFLEILGMYLAILTVVILMLGMMWQSLKPFVEREETRYFKEMEEINSGFDFNESR